MQIEINDHRKIFAVQEEFNQVFPNLKIEFYKRPSTHGGHPAKELVKSRGKTLLDCRVTHQAGPITILPTMTYGELKQNFEDIYGLTIHLSRPSTGKIHEIAPVSEAGTLETLDKEALDKEAV